MCLAEPVVAGLWHAEGGGASMPLEDNWFRVVRGLTWVHPFVLLWGGSGAFVDTLAAMAVECLLLMPLLAAVYPYGEQDALPAPADEDLDGFTLVWPRHWRAAAEDSFATVPDVAIQQLFALPLALGVAVAWTSTSDPVGGMVVAMGVAVPFVIPYFMAYERSRFLFNRLRSKGQTSVQLNGRRLRVGERELVRTAAESLHRDGHRLRILEGEHELVLEGPSDGLDWVEITLERTRPDPEQARVPAALQALKSVE